MPALKVLVSGHVQGVCFRATAKEIADKLNVMGYAKNLPDGRVELLLQAPPQTLNTYLETLKNNPGLGSIDQIDLQEIQLSDQIKSFEIRS